MKSDPTNENPKKTPLELLSLVEQRGFRIVKLKAEANQAEADQHKQQKDENQQQHRRHDPNIINCTVRSSNKHPAYKGTKAARKDSKNNQGTNSQSHLGISSNTCNRIDEFSCNASNDTCTYLYTNSIFQIKVNRFDWSNHRLTNLTIDQ
ncbi:hypothetical protein Lal_00038215 [Lupinus albus]|nr:hypothetical protein Lal_00038215 [Lupinus albus]